MRNITFRTLALCAAALSVNSVFAGEINRLRSPAAKEAICDIVAVNSRDHGVTKETCLSKGTFNVVKEIKSTIEGRQIVTRLVVDLDVEARTFEATIGKEVSIGEAGELIVSRDWNVENLETVSLGDSALLALSNPFSSSNVKKTPNKRGIPIAVLDWTNYAEAPDYALEFAEIYKVYKSAGSTTVIGYIALEDACSSETEQCITSYARFDLDGQMIGDIEEESRGINE